MSNTNYWKEKLQAYLHDPPYKCLDIKNHELYGEKLLYLLGEKSPTSAFWKLADAYASGFERGQFPSYSSDINEDGSIDYLKNTILTHPTSQASNLVFDLKNVKLENLIAETNEFIKIKFDELDKKFSSDPERLSKAKFIYSHLMLRNELARRKIGGLAGLWNRLPADSRIPDHSIWQHNALTSSLNSCLSSSKGNSDDLGLMVFSLSPVQGFIEKARKTRDYWSASVCLSWLAFEGLSWVIENLGPDHVIYPSLVGQPLVAEYLKLKWGMDEAFDLPESSKSIASFPNKFLFLVSLSEAEKIGKSIENHIQNEWIGIANRCENFFERLNFSKNEIENIQKQMLRQAEPFWEYNWSASKLLTSSDKAEISNFVSSSKTRDVWNLVDQFNQIRKHKNYKDQKDIGTLYSVSHRLTQKVLAATKTRRFYKRDGEQGEKCPCCAEFEVMHSFCTEGKFGARDYKEQVDKFWFKLSQNLNESYPHSLKDTEKLCHICFVKRVLPLVMQESKDHLLHKTFSESLSFPSTTEFALWNTIKDPDKRKKEANRLHDSNELESNEKYYALLLMDGDKMGELVNGETLGSTWESALHPEIKEKFKNPKFAEIYRKTWAEIFKKHPKRLLTPAIHAAISESLGDFAIHGVSPIVHKYGGRLIYAGGDDVFAFFPLATVIPAAREIRSYYGQSFLNSSGPISGKVLDEDSKLFVGLGKADRISISAGIVICHHKDNLSESIQTAKKLLKTHAKEKLGRDACSILLKKRSGGVRECGWKWDSPSWEAFSSLSNTLGENADKVSSRFLYGLEGHRLALESILFSKSNETHELAKIYLQDQIFGLSPRDSQSVAHDLSMLIMNNSELCLDAPIIARFFCKQKRDE